MLGRRRTTAAPTIGLRNISSGQQPPNTYVIEGARARTGTQDRFDLTIEGVADPGTFTALAVLYLDTDTGLPVFLGDVSVEVTELSELRMQGTFTGVVTSLTGLFTAPDSVILSDGSFDVPVIR